MSSRIVCLAIVAMLPLMHVAQADGSLSKPTASDTAVTSFDECVRQQGKVLRSYPARCISQDGKEFVQEKKSDQKICKDLCGDGTCQEIVCMAEGCPCPETSATCPKDCR